jgi:hypothetical protein
MDRQQFLFIFLLVGIAMLTEYLSNSDYHSPAVSSNNIFVGTNGSSALLHHIYEISPVEHKAFSAMVKHSSVQF